MEQPMFSVGDKLHFTTDSDLYRDIYTTEVKEVFSDRLELSISLYRGYLLLIPIGTKIRWLMSDTSNIFTSNVITRNPAKQSWSVSIPLKSESAKKTRVIAIGSGKGGVGKTSLAINLSIALSKLGQRVIILDADIGMANVEVLLKLNTDLNLTNVLNGECALRDILTTGPGSIRLLPGSSGISALTNLNPIQFNRIFSGFSDMEDECDIFMIDTGAGISENVLKFLEAADELLLITTTEPHAMMDTYGLTKALTLRNPEIKPQLIINRCENEAEAMRCCDTFQKAASKFLKVKPLFLGWIQDDKMVSKSIKAQKPLILSHPHSPFAESISSMASNLVGKKVTMHRSTGILSFINRLKRKF